MRFASLAVAALLTAAPSLGARVLPFTPHIFCGGYAPGCIAIGWTFQNVFPRDPIASELPTLFTIYVQNLEGSDPLGGSGVSQFPLDMGFARDNSLVDSGVLRTNPYGGFPALMQAYGNAEVSKFPNLSADSYATDIETWDIYEYNNILGCSTDENITPYEYAIRTCPRDGLDGWGRLQLVMGLTYDTGAPTSPVTQEDMLIILPGGCMLNGLGSGFTEGVDFRSPACTLHSYPSSLLPHVTATPEPATLALLAPTLLGIGFVRRRARRSA